MRAGAQRRCAVTAGAFALAGALLALACSTSPSGAEDADVLRCASDADCDPEVDASTPPGETVITPLDDGGLLDDAGTDSGADDGGVDSATPDADPDSGSADSGVTDSGVTDSGVTDSGVTDSGPPPDCSSVSSLVAGDGVTTGTFISEARFYVSGSSGLVRSCWVEFQPNFALWTDGLVKRRWIYLAPGTQIRTSGTMATSPTITATLSMDRWYFPVGTRFVKEFSLPNGRRVETRIWERLPDVGGYPRFRMGSFRWSDINGTGTQLARYTESGSTDSVSGPDPIMLTIDGQSFLHKIPSNTECHRCHDGEPGRALGFTALQLAKDIPDDVSLAKLVSDGWLTSSTGYEASWRFMLDDVNYDANVAPPPTRAALGALHANCGHCHNAWSEANASYITTTGLAAPAEFGLRLRYAQVNVTGSQAYRSSVDRPATFTQLGHTLRIESKEPNKSILWLRAGLRAGMPNGGLAMPPIGTARVDQAMQDDVAAWILALP